MAQSEHPDPKRQRKAKSGNEAEVAVKLLALACCVANESCLQAAGGPATSAQAPAQAAPSLNHKDHSRDCTTAGLLRLR